MSFRHIWLTPMQRNLRARTYLHAQAAWRWAPLSIDRRKGITQRLIRLAQKMSQTKDLYGRKCRRILPLLKGTSPLAIYPLLLSELGHLVEQKALTGIHKELICALNEAQSELIEHQCVKSTLELIHRELPLLAEPGGDSAGLISASAQLQELFEGIHKGHLPLRDHLHKALPLIEKLLIFHTNALPHTLICQVMGRAHACVERNAPWEERQTALLGAVRTVISQLRRREANPSVTPDSSLKAWAIKESNRLNREMRREFHADSSKKEESTTP